MDDGILPVTTCCHINKQEHTKGLHVFFEGNLEASDFITLVSSYFSFKMFNKYLLTTSGTGKQAERHKLL